MTILNWTTSKADAELIDKITQRARQQSWAADLSYMAIRMDLAACHLNGNPLDLAALAEYPPFDFAHDVAGIIGHIDRETGQLRGFFRPRCSGRLVVQ